MLNTKSVCARRWNFFQPNRMEEVHKEIRFFHGILTPFVARLNGFFHRGEVHHSDACNVGCWTLTYRTLTAEHAAIRQHCWAMLSKRASATNIKFKLTCPFVVQVGFLALSWHQTAGFEVVAPCVRSIQQMVSLPRFKFRLQYSSHVLALGSCETNGHIASDTSDWSTPALGEKHADYNGGYA